MSEVRIMKVKILEKRQEIDGVFSFIFQPEKETSWKAGQFAIYKIPHTNQDNRGDIRIFTISSPPYQGKIMLTTRYLFEESSSFKKALFAKKENDLVEILKIQGNFTVEDPNQKIVFIAGGIGITPFHSFLLDLEKRSNIKDIILIYSNKNEDSIIFRNTIDRLYKDFKGLKVHYIFSPQLCDQELIEKLVPDMKERMFYLSGPTRMVDSVDNALQNLNIDKKNIKNDYIPGTGE